MSLNVVGRYWTIKILKNVHEINVLDVIGCYWFSVLLFYHQKHELINLLKFIHISAYCLKILKRYLERIYLKLTLLNQSIK